MNQVENEARTKNLCDDAFAKIVDTLRVASELELAAAPTQNNKSIGDFLTRV